MRANQLSFSFECLEISLSLRMLFQLSLQEKTSLSREIDLTRSVSWSSQVFSPFMLQVWHPVLPEGQASPVGWAGRVLPRPKKGKEGKKGKVKAVM